MSEGFAINPDGRIRLLDVIDRSDHLASEMQFDVIYSLADRPCTTCAYGRRDPAPSVALVKIHEAKTGSRLITLCAEHADEWEARR